MKNIKSSLVTVLAAVGLAITPWVVANPGSAPAVLAQEEEESELIMGIVKETTEKELILRDMVDAEKETKLGVADTTKYVKDGQPAKAKDVAVGNRVMVKAKKLLFGRLEALEVTILPPKPEPTPPPAG